MLDGAQDPKDDEGTVAAAVTWTRYDATAKDTAGGGEYKDVGKHEDKKRRRQRWYT